MEDPCVRKLTTPQPVPAPSKNNSLPIDENKPETNVLEKDLELSDNETAASINNLLAVMVEELVAEGPEKNATQNLETSETSDKTKKENENKKNLEEKLEKKLSKKRIISKEYISDDDDDNENEPRRKTMLISAKPKNQCRYVFVKKPRRGERCLNLTDYHFCSIHVKKDDRKDGLENKIKLAHEEKQIRDLKLATQEITSKVDFLLKKLPENEKRTKTKISELEKCIDGLIKTKQTTFDKEEKVTKKKMHKLNKNLSYKIIEYNGKREMKLEAGKKIVVLTLPKEMTVTDNPIGKTLKYITPQNKFEIV